MNNILQILETKQKKIVFYLFLIALLITILEVLSVGLIFPIIDFVIKGDNSNFNDFFVGFSNFFSINLINLKKKIIIIFIIFFIFKSFLIIYLQYLLADFTQKINVNLANRLFEGYLQLDYKFFNKRYTTSDIIRNIINETASVYSYIYNFIILTIELSIAVIIFFTILAISFKISLVLISFSSLFGYIFIIFFRRRINKWGKQRIKLNKDRIKSLQESFLNFEFIKFDIFKNSFFKKFYMPNFYVNIINRNIRVINILPRIFIELIIILSVFLIISYFYLQNKKLEEFLPLLSLYAVAALKIAPSFSRILNSLNNLKFNYPSLKLLIIELNKIKLNKSKKINSGLSFEKSLSLKLAQFRYNSSDVIQKKYNLNFQKKHTYVIHGESGSGKTTLIKILLGLLKLDSGQIFLDNKKVDTDNENYKKLFGYVPQNIYLYNDNIKNNILLGRKISDKLFNKIIDDSSLKYFYKKKGPNFQIGENGNKISGGEKQRIALARSLVTNPEILIFDEFTSSLDEKNIQKVLSTIRILHKKKTILIVTHDPSKIKFANKKYKI